MWCLNTHTGYLLKFDVYQGKSPCCNEEYENKFGKAASPLIRMIDEFSTDVKYLPISFYFEKLSTSINLLTYLKESGYNGTGIVRENCVPKECRMLPSSAVNKTGKMYSVPEYTHVW
jgi:hypothetical protein